MLDLLQQPSTCSLYLHLSLPYCQFQSPNEDYTNKNVITFTERQEYTRMFVAVHIHNSSKLNEINNRMGTYTASHTI